ncbi:MAG: nucleoside-diphosphate sugar epimerase/dehydratase, partial [Acidimicrobiales bacterium]
MVGLAERLSPILSWAYGRRRIFPVVSDLAAWVVGIFVGGVLKLVFSIGGVLDELLVLAILAVMLQTVLGTISGLYRHRWRVTSFDEVSALGAVWLITSAVLVVGNHLARQAGSDLRTSAVLMGALAAFSIMGFVRGVWRRFWERSLRPDEATCHRTVVFGAGVGGTQMVKAMLLDAGSSYFPVALLDDDPAKANREIDGVKVLG